MVGIVLYSASSARVLIVAQVTLPPTNMEVHKAAFQEQSSLSTVSRWQGHHLGPLLNMEQTGKTKRSQARL